MDVLYQFDEKYAPFASASIASLLENNEGADRIRIFILEMGICEESKGKLTEQVKKKGREIVFLESAELAGLIEDLGIPSYRGSAAANMRLFAEQVVPADCERLLYLDSDTLVVGSVEPLFETDLKGCPLGMVMDSLVRRHKRDIGMSKDAPYFNSGMILYDLPRYREMGCTDAMISHIKNVRASYPNPDQDLLNVVFAGHIYPVECKYNFQPMHRVFSLKSYYKVYGQGGYYGGEVVEDAVKDPRVLHFFRFVGQFPWHEKTLHPDRELFWEYLAKTPWAGFLPWPDDSGIVYALERVLYHILPKTLFLAIFHQSHEIFTWLQDRKSKG